MKKLFFMPLLGMVLISVSCNRKAETKTETLTVKTDTVRNYENELYVSFPGRVKAKSDIDLSFRVSGPIVRIAVNEGQHVRKGDLIAQIDPRDYEIQFAATEAEYKQVKSEAERIIELYNRKGVSENDHDKAVAGLTRITSKYNAHRNALEDTKLTAPFDGYVQRRYHDVNETVAAGMPVVSLISSGKYEVDINLPASDYARAKQFTAYSCLSDVFPGKKIELAPIEISRKANANGLYNMRFDVKSSDAGIAAGMSVNVTIGYTPEEQDRTIIPVSAVFGKDGKSAVWVYDPSTQTVSSRSVKQMQIFKNGTTVISEGLDSGEIVVSAGVSSLEEGMKVKVLGKVSKTNIGGLL